MLEINSLLSESSNLNTVGISTMDVIEILKLINNEDALVSKSVETELKNIELAVTAIADRFSRGGRIIYVGAGSSGRLGLMDAAEILPTYGIDSSRCYGIIAGGQAAVFEAVEGAEDSVELATSDFLANDISELDVIIGIAASGRTPYTIEFLKLSKQRDALTVSVTTNKPSQMSLITDFSIDVEVGPEVISGSTRMKSGTAQKMILNMISTSVMIKLGRVYQNQMIFVQASNEKLKHRACNIFKNCTNTDDVVAREWLNQSNYRVAEALLMFWYQIDFNDARLRLEQSKGNFSVAIEGLSR